MKKIIRQFGGAIAFPSDYPFKAVISWTFLLLCILIVFQPFYFSQYSITTKLGVAVTYVLILGCCFGTTYLIIKRLKAQHVRDLIWLLSTCILSGICIFSFKVFAGFYSFSLVRILTGLLALGAFSGTVVGVHWLSRNIVPKTDDEKRGARVVSFENGLSLFEHLILCIESQKNYLLITHSDEGRLVTTKIRQTMKSCIGMLSDQTLLFQCHRSFIVNLGEIDCITGTKKQPTITLKQLNTVIPVSRALLTDLRIRMQYQHQSLPKVR